MADESLEEDLAWKAQALCKGSTHLFYADQGRNEAGRHKRVRMAREICNLCPVMIECRDYAVEHNEEHGIWGGTSSRQRKNIRRAQSGQSNRETNDS